AFLERRTAFVEAFSWPNVPNNVTVIAISLADRIKSAEEKRHMVIHGMANEYTIGPESDRLPSEALKINIIRDHPKHFYCEIHSVREIEMIADDLAAINGDLMQLYFWAWGTSLHPSL